MPPAPLSHALHLSHIRVKIGTSVIKETKEQMLLGINIDNKLTLKSHVETLCKKAAQKLHALARIANYMETEQLASLMNAFIMSHFSYCPLVWMPGGGYMTCGWTGVCRPAFRKVPSSNYRKLPVSVIPTLMMAFGGKSPIFGYFSPISG